MVRVGHAAAARRRRQQFLEHVRSASVLDDARRSLGVELRRGVVALARIVGGGGLLDGLGERHVVLLEAPAVAADGDRRQPQVHRRAEAQARRARVQPQRERGEGADDAAVDEDGDGRVVRVIGEQSLDRPVTRTCSSS